MNEDIIEIADSEKAEMTDGEATRDGSHKWRLPVILAALVVALGAALYALFSNVNAGRADAVAKDVRILCDDAAGTVSDAFDAEIDYAGNIDWDALHKIDPNVMAWIHLEDSAIDYPVAKGTDNDFYLHHLIDGSYKFAGTIFVDCDDEEDLDGFYTVIYGHHMKDGSMFSTVGRYMREPDFYDSHKVVEILTPDEKYHLRIFSAFITDARGYVYDYQFPSDESKQSHLDKLIAADAVGTDDVDVTIDDHIVTLSTCVAATGYARYVAVGKLEPWTAEEKYAAMISGEVEPVSY